MLLVLPHLRDRPAERRELVGHLVRADLDLLGGEVRVVELAGGVDDRVVPAGGDVGEDRGDGRHVLLPAEHDVGGLEAEAVEQTLGPRAVGGVGQTKGRDHGGQTVGRRAGEEKRGGEWERG